MEGAAHDDGVLCAAQVVGGMHRRHIFEADAGIQEWELGSLSSKLAPGLYVVEVISEEGVCAIKAMR